MGERSPGFRTLIQLTCYVPLLLVAILCWGDTLFLEWEGQFGYGQVKDYGLPAALMEQFRLYDTDADGYIDPLEFFNLQQHLNKVVLTMHGS